MPLPRFLLLLAAVLGAAALTVALGVTVGGRLPADTGAGLPAVMALTLAAVVALRALRRGR